MNRILIITNDSIGAEMAGPAIRCWEMASVLSNEHDVILGSTKTPSADSLLFDVCHITERSLPQLCRWADILILQPLAFYSLPLLRDVSRPIVIDLYNVFAVESMEANKTLTCKERQVANRVNLSILRLLFTVGDYFLCSGERQKDFWLGMLYLMNRLGPDIYSRDPSGNSLMGIVPNGISSTPPARSKNVVKGVLPSVKLTDKLIIWGGSICNWFDPVTLVQALAIICRKRDDVKLYFLGSKAPCKDIPGHIWSEAARAVTVSQELGLYQKQIIFNPDWTPYQDRANFLLEADLGISLHYSNLETRYSYRTRILDYLWAGLPVVTTEGDVMAQLVQIHQLGRVVPSHSPQAVAAAITGLIDDSDGYQRCKANIAAIRPEFYWQNLMQPLLEYCRNPWRKFAG